MSIEQEIADATSKLELTAIAKRLQLRKIPAGLSTEALKQVLLNVVGSHTVHIEKQCGCTHLKTPALTWTIQPEWHSSARYRPAMQKYHRSKLVTVMRYAELDELKPIYGLFSTRRDIFPHIRQDTLRRRIENKQCIYEDGVVITFQQYRKRTRVGDFNIPYGSIMLHQIVNGNQFNGFGGRVFDRFFEEIVVPSGGDLYLTVRFENTTACAFYGRHGMIVVGTVSWAGRTIPGLLYRKTVN